MTDTLDNILSGSSETAPETNEQEIVTQTVESESPQEPTDDQQESTTRMVPHEALHAEKQKVKRYTEQVSDFQRQLSDTNAAWERRMAELVKAVSPKTEPAPKPDWFENPEMATQNAVQSTVSPQFEQINQTLQANAQLIAGIKYGDDAVSTAEQAFLQAVQSRQLDPSDYHKVVNSPNRYAAAVQWHKAQQAKEEIGDDPAAFRAKLEAEILAKHGLTNEGSAATPAAPQAVMPSNLTSARNVGTRSAPAWSGPPTLNDIFDTRR